MANGDRVCLCVLHEFDLATKVKLIDGLIRDCLAADGMLVIGGVSSKTVQERKQARLRWSELWDDQEYYWAAGEAVDELTEIGLRVEYRQVSACAGVMVIRPSE